MLHSVAAFTEIQTHLLLSFMNKNKNIVNQLMTWNWFTLYTIPCWDIARNRETKHSSNFFSGSSNWWIKISQVFYFFFCHWIQVDGTFWWVFQIKFAVLVTVFRASIVLFGQKCHFLGSAQNIYQVSREGKNKNI